MDKLLPLKIPPGMRNNGTVYSSKGRWYSGNFVRFFQDTIQPIGGWLARTLTGATIEGVPRGMHAWATDVVGGVSQPPALAIGSTGDISGLTVISGTVKYNITPALITTQGNLDTRIWQLESFGNYLIALAHDPTDYSKTRGPFVWTGDTAAIATDIGTAVARATNLVVTAERFFVLLGGVDPNAEFSLHSGTIPSQRLVSWATQEAGTAAADWTPSAANTAGNYYLPTDGALRCGARTRSGTIILTTTDAWMMTYIGGQFVHRFDQVGEGCGAISTKALVANDTAAFWMGPHSFHAYDGFVKPIPCDVHDYVFNSLNRSYAHLIWALENPAFGEVTWFYPHAAQTEITRYVTYNYRENHWVTGTLARTCGVASQPGVHEFPVMCNASASVFDHETGSARNSEGTVSLESGPIELGDGDHLMQVQSVLPDDKTVGDVNLTLYGAMNPDASETTYGPYTLAARTTFRAKMRQVRVKLTEVVATAWRVGVIRLGVVQSSRR